MSPPSLSPLPLYCTVYIRYIYQACIENMSVLGKDVIVKNKLYVNCGKVHKSIGACVYQWSQNCRSLCEDGSASYYWVM